MTSEAQAAFDTWYAALLSRHLPLVHATDLRKGLQALSTLYVERRDRMEEGKALRSPAKQAAFALFYGPLHFVTVASVVQALGAAATPLKLIQDLGCGTGVGGAAWAAALGGAPRVHAVDESPWAVDETWHTLRALGLEGKARRGDLVETRLPTSGSGILAAYAVNELAPRARDRLLANLLRAHERGARILILEPISRAVSPWWESWARELEKVGGRSDDWRFPCTLPAPWLELDRAAGLRHDELTARSLWVGG